MTSKEGCVQVQIAPELQKGETVADGVFLRNLAKKGEVSKRYANDDDEAPVYGYKLANKFWKNAVQRGDLSLNEHDCVSSESCSIAIHPHASNYFHVAILNLAKINECLVGHSFVAQYDPLEEPPQGPNACHFELLPVDGSTQSLFALQTFLDSPFPQGKMPDSDKNRSDAKAAWEKYKQVVTIKRWVRSPDGELA